MSQVTRILEMARASEKCGSLHTGGAISQLTRKKRMEKELGRPRYLRKSYHKEDDRPHEEKNGLSHVLKRHRFVQKVEEYHSTQSLESQDAPLLQEVTKQLWRESADEPVRGLVYGYTEKAYHEKKSWFYCSSSSNIDSVD